MKLTRKQKAFVKELVDNPKQSATQAALKVYGKPNNPTTYSTAATIANANLKLPKIQQMLESYGEEAVGTIYQIMKTDYQDSKSPADTRLNAAKDIADRVLGKATQKVESTSTSVNLNLTLSDIVQ